MNKQVSPKVTVFIAVLLVVVLAMIGYKVFFGPVHTGKPTPSVAWTPGGSMVASPGATPQQMSSGGMVSGGMASPGMFSGGMASPGMNSGGTASPYMNSGGMSPSTSSGGTY
jgi:hypothetical protein